MTIKIEEINEKMKKYNNIAYFDEAGAGPLCGDLIVCGIILQENNLILKDSKKLSEKKREYLYDEILKHAINHVVIKISPKEIDDINIFNARMLGFKKAIEYLKPEYALIDGNKKPDVMCECDAIVKGDDLIPGISAASIIAKVTRDRDIINFSKKEPYSNYMLEKHKGYGTKIHMEKLKEFGPIENFHRMTYRPVKEALLSMKKS